MGTGIAASRSDPGNCEIYPNLKTQYTLRGSSRTTLSILKRNEKCNIVTMTTPDSRVIIVGAGVFGLSTALWLARSGYMNVTIFDRQPYDRTFYNPADGCDSASSDINKIFRATYGTKEQ